MSVFIYHYIWLPERVSVLDPPVYPHIVLYPAVASEENTTIQVDLQNKASAVFRYPFLVICKCNYAKFLGVTGLTLGQILLFTRA